MAVEARPYTLNLICRSGQGYRRLLRATAVSGVAGGKPGEDVKGALARSRKGVLCLYGYVMGDRVTKSDPIAAGRPPPSMLMAGMHPAALQY